jgi:protein tyrosine phosphatase (PTP) superfamily phosphohydrolase (DUF442 family)
MLRKTLWLTGALLVAAVLALVGVTRLGARWRATLRVTEVVPGVLRANQPPPDELAGLAKRWGIRTVVNFRGHNNGEDWHVAELEACRQLGLRHEDVRVKIDDWVAQHEARRFVKLLETAPRPILMHCKDGVDRSGWGAAVASLLAGSSLESGVAELATSKGHVCNPSTCRLCRFFALYRRYLGERRLTHDSATFRRWVMESYCPQPYDAEIEILRQPTTLRVNPADPLKFTVRVRNRSQEPWHLSDGKFGVRLGARMLGPFAIVPEQPIQVFRTPNNPARDVARAGMEDGVIGIGRERTFTFVFPAPAMHGRYVLQIDMVDELVHWFSDLGPPGVLVHFEVVEF